MSQSGLLSEDEVRTFINEGFSLKIERDNFIKPTKEFVFDIYSRFLDFFNLPWRKPNPLLDYDETGPNLKIRMVGSMTKILSKYSTPFEFNMNDLLMPSRKRTTVFLNILIYIKAQVDEAWGIWQADKADWIERQQDVEKIKGEISQLKLEIEDKAFKKIQLLKNKTIEELRKENLELRGHFESIRNEGESLSTKSNEIKSNIKEQTELLKKEELELEMLMKRDEEIKSTLKKLNEGRELKKRIQQLKESLKRECEQLGQHKENLRKEKMLGADLERILVLQDSTKDDLPKQIESVKRTFARAEQERANIESQLNQARADQVLLTKKEASLQERIEDLDRLKNKMSLQHKIKLEQVKLDFAKEVGEADEIYQEVAAKVAKLKDEIKELRARRAEVAARQTDASDKSKAQIFESNRRLEVLRKQFQEFKTLSQPIIPQIIEKQKKIDMLMGKPKEIELPASNRTYINDFDKTYNKEPDRTYNKESDRTYNKESDRTYNKESDRTYNKESDRTYNKEPDRTYIKEAAADKQAN